MQNLNTRKLAPNYSPKKLIYSPLIRSISYLRGHIWGTIGSLICLSASAAGNLAVPRITQHVIDSGIINQQTKLILTGDIQQIDNSYVDAVSNGLTYAVEKFKKYGISGHVSLLKGERSKLATLASEIL